jgi:hypothetical protein
MKPSDITHRIELIARVVDDEEEAHKREDALQLDFIKFVARTEAVPISVRRKAKQIIEVSTWDFSRFYI